MQRARTRTQARTPRRLVAAAAAGLLMTTVAGCGGASGASDEGGDKSFTIAIQPGVAYAPLLIAKQERLIQKRLPGTKLSWKELDSGAAVRDGVISGDVDVAAGGNSPFIVGYDAGVQWKVLMAMDTMNIKLMAKDPSIESLKDFTSDSKIAMPAPDSTQSVVLRKAAQEQLGNASALDSNIVSLEHPDGVKALLADQIDAHLTSIPFQDQEEAAGAHAILQSDDLFPETTFTSIYAETDLASESPEFVKALTASVNEGIQMINNDPDRAAKILSAESGGEYSVAEFKKEITNPDVAFTAKPKGFGTFADFMAQVGMVKQAPKPSDLFFQNQYTAGGS